MTRGDFQRLDHQLDRLRRNMRETGESGGRAGERMNRLNQSLGAVQGRMRRLSETGQLTRREMDHMRTSLSLVSREAANAARSGEISRNQYRTLRTQVDQTRITFDNLNRDLNLHRTRLDNSADSANRLRMQEERLRLAWARTQQAAVRIRQAEDRIVISRQRLSGATRTMNDDNQFAGGMFDRFRQKAIGGAVALGATLLPTIGALAPMVAGLGSIVGVAALAFSGLDKPTKFLSKSEKEFLKDLRPVTKEFRNLQQAARDAILPQLSKSFGDIRNAVKSLNPVIEIAGGAFSRLVQKMAKGINSDAFSGPFLQNVKMGTKWVEDFTASFGTFLIKFFEFGAKSQPALDAWQRLLGGFLDTGLPGMFEGLEQGIQGSSEWLTALADIINGALLPALGKISGSFMEAFGPLMSELLGSGESGINGFAKSFESAMEIIEPVALTAADAVRALNEVFSIGFSVIGSFASALGGALLESLAEVSGKGNAFDSLRDGYQGFSRFVTENQEAIRSAFVAGTLVLVDFVTTGVSMMPSLIGAFATLTDVVLTAFDTMVSGAATAFGWLPGIGDKLIAANEQFDTFASGVREGLDKAQTKAQEFSDSFSPKANKIKLEIQVNEAEANLQHIKEQLQDPNLTTPQKIKLLADKELAERAVRDVRGKLDALNYKKSIPKIAANASQFFGEAARVEGRSIRSKSVPISANTGSFWGSVASVSGRILGTSYINVQYRQVESQASTRFGRTGGLAGTLPRKRFAEGGSISGGVLDGPGTKTSDSLVARLSRGEFVMQAKAVDKYGVDFMQRVNSGQLDLPGFAKGGMTPKQKAAAKAKAKAKADAARRKKAAAQKRADAAKAEREARNDLADQFGISHFGKMAGYQRTPFEKGIAAPQDMGSLTSALNAARGTIKKATHGGTESRLLKQLDSAGRGLIKYEKNLTAVNSRLEKAKSTLADLKTSFKQLKESVQNSVLSFANITKLAQGDKPVTVAGISASMSNSRDKATAFSGALKGLRDKGLSKDLISQIAEAGIDGGGLETAGALLTASASEISSINSLQSQIAGAAKAAGTTAADAMYGAGIKAADGLVKGLTKQQKAIEAAMMKIAKSMEKAIKKALGIKSPSRVMQEIGHQTAEGYALGMERNRRTDRAWESLLGSPSSVGGTPASAPASGGPMVVQLHLAGRPFGEVVVDTVRREVRTRGGNVQAVLGK